MSDLEIKRALVSVSNKDNLGELVKYFIKYNVKVISSGGTYDFLKQLIERRYQKRAVFKQVFTSNRMRYIAVLAKENKLPNNLLFSYTEILNDLTLTKKEF